MALIDVSEVLTDPQFTVRFDVYRRDATVNAHGRNQSAAVLFAQKQVGVSYPDGSQRRENGADSVRAVKQEILITRYPLRQLGPSWQADQVLLKGIMWNVKEVSGYSQFGSGFKEVLLEVAAATTQEESNGS